MKISILLSTSVLLCMAFYGNTFAQSAPPLGNAKCFAALAYSTITNTGPTVLAGNVGVSPGSAITGFPPGVYSGTSYSGASSLAGNAQTDATAAYNNLKSNTVPPGHDLTGKVLGQTAGAITLTPGVYFFSSSAHITGTLTLNDGGNKSAVFIFLIGSTLVTDAVAPGSLDSRVVMSSGGDGPNVFWQVSSSATIGTYSQFVGNIIAFNSITMTTGATTTGRLIALNGAVTFDTNNGSLNCNEVLPITLSSFTGTSSGCKANLLWQTATEINSAFYGVEYSKDGSTFTQVGSLQSKNCATGSTYGFNWPLSIGNNYFRLKAVDADGKFFYSQTIMISGKGACGTDSQVKVSPNPTKDVINLDGLAVGSHVALINISGQKITEFTATGPTGHINISGSAKGIYVLRIISLDGNVSNARVVAQ